MLFNNTKQKIEKKSGKLLMKLREEKKIHNKKQNVLEVKMGYIVKTISLIG